MSPLANLQWSTTSGEVFAFSGWHDERAAFVYSFVPIAGGWKNRSTSELIDMGGADCYATLEDAQAWAACIESEPNTAAPAAEASLTPEH